jgi:hypothetical protein
MPGLDILLNLLLIIYIYNKNYITLVKIIKVQWLQNFFNINFTYLFKSGHSICIKNWASSRQNQHNGFATSNDPDKPVHAVRLPTLLQVEKLIANSMDPDQPAPKCRLVWIHAGRKPIMLVLSWHGSNVVKKSP